MSEMDVIRQLAEKAMKTPMPTGDNDNWLWDRTLRILRNVEIICRIPEVINKDIPIDRFCLSVAAYFADVGFSRCTVTENDIIRPVLSDINLTELRDFSAQIAAIQLGVVLPKPKIEKCCKIILESANRFTDMTEAAILSDARNLDDMGVVGLQNEFRRAAIQGKGISTILDTWKRKMDYRYWQARLREGFRFESIRQLAEKRLNTAVWLMEQLAAEHYITDLETPRPESSYRYQTESITVQPK